MKTDAGNRQLLGAFNHASILKQTLEQSLQITTFASCISTLSQILQSRFVIVSRPP